MMIDPYSIQKMAAIQNKERMERAEQDRLVKAIAVSDSSLLNYIRAAASGMVQRMKPASPAGQLITGEHKRATAEIPSA
jgi:hypothetical protein